MHRALQLFSIVMQGQGNGMGEAAISGFSQRSVRLCAFVRSFLYGDTWPSVRSRARSMVLSWDGIRTHSKNLSAPIDAEKEKGSAFLGKPQPIPGA